MGRHRVGRRDDRAPIRRRGDSNLGQPPRRGRSVSTARRHAVSRDAAWPGATGGGVGVGHPPRPPGQGRAELVCCTVHSGAWPLEGRRLATRAERVASSPVRPSHRRRANVGILGFAAPRQRHLGQARHPAGRHHGAVATGRTHAGDAGPAGSHRPRWTRVA